MHCRVPWKPQKQAFHQGQQQSYGYEDADTLRERITYRKSFRRNAMAILRPLFLPFVWLTWSLLLSTLPLPLLLLLRLLYPKLDVDGVEMRPSCADSEVIRLASSLAAQAACSLDTM